MIMQTATKQTMTKTLRDTIAIPLRLEPLEEVVSVRMGATGGYVWDQSTPPGRTTVGGGVVDAL